MISTRGTDNWNDYQVALAQYFQVIISAQQLEKALVRIVKMLTIKCLGKINYLVLFLIILRACVINFAWLLNTPDSYISAYKLSEKYN